MKKFSIWIKDDFKDTKLLFRSIPSWALILFVMSVCFMNLFANKEVGLNLSWLALDCGFFLSWLSFLALDVIVKRFGVKASIKCTLFALLCNLGFAIFSYLITLLPGNWSEFYNSGEEAVNSALNNTFGGTWYVLLGSSIAFIVSSILNIFLNWGIGKTTKRDNFGSFVLRSYVSTFIAQFIDNLIFAEIVSLNFFGWNQVQCVVCALTGGIAELLMEVIFSPFGYIVAKGWDKDNVGVEYRFLNKIEG